VSNIFTRRVKILRKSVTILGFKIEEDPTDSGVTGFAGLLPYMDLWRRLGVPCFIDENVHICGSQGWLDRQMIESLVLLNLAGGECVTDMDRLEADAGLCRVFSRNQYSGMGRLSVKEAQKRFRGGRSRTFPAATQISTFLEACHNEEEEKKRVPGKAFIPAVNESLGSLLRVNTHLIDEAQRLNPCEVATLDCDATLVERHAKTALPCYKGFLGYQPFNIFWAEQEMVLHSEFRDGNVPAGFDLLRPIREAISLLPDSVKTVFVRQDTAGYRNEDMAWFEREAEHPQFGRIGFTISADITQDFRKAVARVKPQEWVKEYKVRAGKQVCTGREYAEVIYMSNAQATLTGVDEAFRFIAIREKMSAQLSLLEHEGTAPFPVMTMNHIAYKLHAIVTNRREEPAEELIAWHYQRCGKSEEAHSIMKSDFAGGQLPSAKFGANAAWWALMILSMNFHTLMKRIALGNEWKKKRMKAVRYDLIAAPGRIVHHARQAFMRLSKPLQEWFFKIEAALNELQPART
jgi:hypothetical protein